MRFTLTVVVNAVFCPDRFGQTSVSSVVTQLSLSVNAVLYNNETNLEFGTLGDLILAIVEFFLSFFLLLIHSFIHPATGHRISDTPVHSRLSENPRERQANSFLIIETPNSQGGHCSLTCLQDQVRCRWAPRQLTRRTVAACVLFPLLLLSSTSPPLSGPPGQLCL